MWSDGLVSVLLFCLIVLYLLSTQSSQLQTISEEPYGSRLCVGAWVCRRRAIAATPLEDSSSSSAHSSMECWKPLFELL